MGHGVLPAIGILTTVAWSLSFEEVQSDGMRLPTGSEYKREKLGETVGCSLARMSLDTTHDRIKGE